jgi:excisionase family DNA binding protein
MSPKYRRGNKLPRTLECRPSCPEPEAVSIEEARRLFGIGRTKLYELIRDGVLPTVKLGKRRLVRPATMRRVLASLERAGIAQRAA